MRSRSLELDILRGFAVVLVLFRHTDISNLQPPVSLTNFFSITTLQRGGWIGVDIFFVLSGFLVSGLLYKEYQQTGSVNIVRFLARRGFKIYPSFYFLIISTSIIWLKELSNIYPKQILCELAYLQNYCSGLPTQGHTWSLAVEEHFYLIFSLMVLFLSRKRNQNPFSILPKIYIFLLFGCLTLRLLATPGVPDLETDYLPTHLRLDSLMCGATIAYFYYFKREKFLAITGKIKYILLPLGLLMLLPAFLFEIIEFQFISTFGLSLFQIGSGFILASMLTIRIPRNWLTQGIATIGLHSYSIYIWHWTINIILLAFIPAGTTLFALVFLTISLVFGISMGLLFETPILKIRDRLIPSISKRNQAIPEGMVIK